MTEAFLSLSREDQLDALGVAAETSERPIHVLEKDIWVVWALEAIFTSDEGDNIVFKGGTSLSKGYGIIQRFSEDIDLTYDIRKIIPDLAKGKAPLPPNNAQAQKWRAQIEEKLAAWVAEKGVAILKAHAEKTGVDVEIVAEGCKIVINYDPLTDGNDYMPPRIVLEFGARSTGEPAENKPVTCEAAQYLDDLQFPTASPRAMLPTRTFWEKATAVHAFCLNTPKGDRISRHWYDLVRLDDASSATAALNDRALANEVAEHKSMFFRAKDRDGKEVDYKAAVSGRLTLVPDAEARKTLAADYEEMREAGMLPDNAETFDEILERCADLQQRANG